MNIDKNKKFTLTNINFIHEKRRVYSNEIMIIEKESPNALFGAKDYYGDVSDIFDKSVDDFLHELAEKYYAKSGYDPEEFNDFKETLIKNYLTK